MTLLKIWLLANVAVFALLANFAAMAQPVAPSPDLQACQMKLGNEVNSGLQSSSAAFALKARVDALEKELADEKAKNKDAPTPKAE